MPELEKATALFASVFDRLANRQAVGDNWDIAQAHLNLAQAQAQERTAQALERIANTLELMLKIRKAGR